MRALRSLGAVLLIAIGGLFLVSRTIQPGPDQRSEAIAQQERIKVQVLNAGGVNGLARLATGHLRDAGFDVVEYGDAESWDRDSTWVLDRVGRPEVADAVAEALGIANVLSEPDPDLFVDVTVLLGREWTPGGPPGELEEGSGALPWWNPRRWIGP